MPTLAVYRGDQFVKDVELGETTIRIGRAPENDLVLEDRDKGVSRSHAEIRFDRGRYLIVDLNSQNGVRIGERRVQIDTLPVDVPITIGPYRLVLKPEAATAVQPDPVSDNTMPVVEPEEPRVDPTEFVDQGTRPSHTQAVAPAPAPNRPAPKRMMLLVAAIAGVAILAVVLLVTMRRREPPLQTAIATTTTTTTSTVPPEPTSEELLQAHLAKADEYIASGDKAAALAENTQASTVLPSDQRVIDQRAKIDAMADPTVLADPPLIPEPGPTSPPAAPSPLSVSRRANETRAQREARDKAARGHLENGKKAYLDRNWPEAIQQLQLALDVSDRLEYGTKPNEAHDMLQSAKAAQAEATVATSRADAQKLLVEAKALAGSDIPAAWRKLRDARARDPQIAGADALLKTLQDQAKVIGEEALGDAKNFENKKRTDEAIGAFTRALQHLEIVPGGHEGVAFAKQHLAILKGSK